jgi:hypothetical protein
MDSTTTSRVKVLVVAYNGEDAEPVLDSIKLNEPELSAECEFTVVKSSDLMEGSIPQHDGSIVVGKDPRDTFDDDDGECTVYSQMIDSLRDDDRYYMSAKTRNPIVAIWVLPDDGTNRLYSEFHVHGGRYTILQYGYRMKKLKISNTSKHGTFYPFVNSPLKYIVTRVRDSLRLELGHNIHLVE